MIRDSATIRDIVKEEKDFQKTRPNSAYITKSKSPRSKRISRNQMRMKTGVERTRPTTAKFPKSNSQSKQLHLIARI